MNIAWIDPVGGLAGDMIVAALLDAGAPESGVLAELAGLGLPGWSAHSEKVWRGPFHATRFVVTLEGGQPSRASHDHTHAHGEADAHDHAHGAAPETRDRSADGRPAWGDPPATELGMAAWRSRSRRWTDIRALLLASSLPPRARDRAMATFSRLAEAEGRVHGMPADAVTFHEVGAIDSIVDVVAACVALELLGVDQLFVGTIPLGHGHTLGDHGWIPLPAPATVECLKGLSVEGRDLRGETVTPTGAALVGALATSGPMPSMRITGSGVGAGTWDPASHPNVVRIVLGRGEPDSATRIVELRAEVDSLLPEAIPPLIEALLAAGALDAYTTPIVMKKGRPGFLVTALVGPGARVPVGEVLLRHGRTLGYRWNLAEREVLARRIDQVRTAWGEVGIKVGHRDDEVIHVAPEYEDCARLARECALPVAEVMGAALAAWSQGRG